MKDSDWEFLRQLYLTPNITKVANTLYISQPALSKRLQTIEEEMNLRIVYRNKSGLEFTPEGKYLAQQALRYYDFMEETRRNIDMLRSNHRVSISIGASLSYLKYKLPELISHYNKLCPDVRFDITGGRSREVISLVNDGTVDFGIIRGVPSDGMEKIQINTEKGYIVSNGPVELSALASTPRIAFPLNDYCQKQVDGWWKQNCSAPPRIGMTVEHMDQTWPMVAQGLGYSLCFLPEQPNIAMLNALTLTPITTPDGEPIVRHTWLIYLPNRSFSIQHQDFISFVREAAEQAS